MPSSSAETRPSALHRGDEVTLTMEKVADQGKCLAYHNSKVIFVPRTLPHESVRAVIVKKRKKFAEAKPIEIVQPSADRVQPRCIYFDHCGGCSLQHVRYSRQLMDKHFLVQQAMHHVADLPDLNVLEPIPAPHPYGYRNKMEFSFSSYRWLTQKEIASGEIFDTSFALGLHPLGVFSKVLDLHQCHLHSERNHSLVNGIRTFVQESEWEPWNWRLNEGFLRHLVLRESVHTSDFMVNFVTSYKNPYRVSLLKNYLQKHYRFVTTLVNTINSSPAHTSFGDHTETIYGSGHLTDKIGDLSFQIAPHSFFQVNTLQAEELVKTVGHLADITPEDHIYDLYCGTGTIALSLAKHAQHVTGIELIEGAIDNANNNAALNGIKNCTFISGDMLKLLKPDFIRKHGHPDIVILDPPRAGMHPKVAQQVASLHARKIIYVSCNVQSQARDLCILSKTYRPVLAQPIDLFPQTHHIENIVVLEKRS